MGNKAKHNKTKKNRGVNVQSIVYANVECDSLRPSGGRASNLQPLWGKLLSTHKGSTAGTEQVKG